ncbi:MAG TPA: VWA domain-containing protein [Candidatus Binataceae bacterium]|nr:VWA domain-containing protein [Candidatus Binataceae bacterium]
MTPLRDQLLEFIDGLRAEGVRISVAETIDAMNAVAAAGLERARMREALAAAVIKDEADRVTFDAAFERFFAAAARLRGEHRDVRRGLAQSAASGRGRPGEEPSPHAVPEEPRHVHARPPQSARAGKEETRESKDRDRARHETRDRDDRGAVRKSPRERDEAAGKSADEHESGAESRRLARLRAIERKPFRDYSDLDYDEARAALVPLERRFRIRLGRRLRIANAGRVDFRRTIRAAIQHGGALADLRFRARRPRHVDLVILADISGSVRYAAELMLALAAGASGCFRRVRSFVYIDRLAEAEFEQGHLVMTPALDLHARSDFGRVLGELWERRAELLNRRTLVVVMGDGRNNRRPARADLLREIAGIVRGVVWLNPEDPARWGTGDSAINQYAREVRALLPSRDLRELSRGLLAVA